LSAYPSRIVNIHPSLLPSFPGKDAVGQAIEHGVKVTGVTVHLVDEGMDTGPILAQCAVDVVDGDVEKTAEAIHAVEHFLYKDTLARLFS
jgi:phosphoribosylglycinamide formyltransferase 1